MRLDVHLQHWEHLFFADLNATLAFYAIVAFVGIGNSVVDLWVQLRGWLYRPVRPRRRSPVGTAGGGRLCRRRPGAIGDWASVLHYGTPGVGHRGVAGRTREIAVEPGRSRRRAAAARRCRGLGRLRGVHLLHRLPADHRPRQRTSAVGYEALTRFADGQSPQERLAAASTAGIGVELDAGLAHAALASATRSRRARGCR